MHATISMNIHKYYSTKFNTNVYTTYSTSKVYTANNSHWSRCNLQINTNRLIIEHVTCNFHGSDSSIFPFFFSFRLPKKNWKVLELYSSSKQNYACMYVHMLYVQYVVADSG